MIKCADPSAFDPGVFYLILEGYFHVVFLGFYWW